MLRVGLTGGLASGKSFVGRALADLGCVLIQADELGHLVMAPDGEAYAGIVREFGSGILNPDRSINRRALGAMVFGNPERLAALNALVHPPVRAREQALVAAFADRNPGGVHEAEREQERERDRRRHEQRHRRPAEEEDQHDHDERDAERPVCSEGGTAAEGAGEACGCDALHQGSAGDICHFGSLFFVF